MVDEAETVKPAEQIAIWADRLRDISAMGLLFADGVHQEEAFRSVQTIAIEMTALATGESTEQLEPLRASVFARPTPIASGDAAVIDNGGRILLVRRADSGRWAMPGGALEVGETPAKGVVREVLEETGVRCRAVSLIGVFDSRHSGARSAHHLYQFTFLCGPLNDGVAETPSHGAEVLDTAWFPEDRLPESIEPGHGTRIPEAYRVWHGDATAFFDRG